jgi:hypothetical protein
MLSFVFLPLKSQDFVISTPKQKLYPMENHVDIIVKGVPFDSIYLTSTNGYVRKEENHFVIQPKKPGNTLIKVFVISGIDTNYIGVKEIRVESFFAHTEVALSGVNRGMISKQQLLAQFGLEADVINLDISISFQITDFRLIIMRGDTFVYTFKSDTNRFSEEIKKGFKLVQSGDILHFVDIKILDPMDNKKKINLKGISCEIK